MAGGLKFRGLFKFSVYKPSDGVNPNEYTRFWGEPYDGDKVRRAQGSIYEMGVIPYFGVILGEMDGREGTQTGALPVHLAYITLNLERVTLNFEPSGHPFPPG